MSINTSTASLELAAIRFARRNGGAPHTAGIVRLLKRSTSKHERKAAKAICRSYLLAAPAPMPAVDVIREPNLAREAQAIAQGHPATLTGWLPPTMRVVEVIRSDRERASTMRGACYVDPAIPHEAAIDRVFGGEWCNARNSAEALEFERFARFA